MKYLNNSGKKRIVRYRKYLFCLGFLLLVLLEILTPFLVPTHPYFWFDRLPGFYSAFGLIGCILTIIICKAIGRRWLMKNEDYYDVKNKKGGHLD